MEKLSHYLKAHGLTQEAFASRIGVTQSFLSKICTGKRGPDIGTAVTIERETKGAVPVESWVAFQALANRRHRRSSGGVVQ